MSGERLHVLMVTDAIGGAFNHTLTLARALRERGVEVSVAVLGPSPAPDQWAQLGSVGALAVRHLDARLEWMADPWEDLTRAGAGLLELERELHPDVIHAGSFFCGSIGFAAPVVVVAHSCVYSWWRAVHHCEPPAAWHRYRRMVSAGLAAADAVVAPSATMLAELRTHYGRLARHALAILNGAPPERRLARKESFVLAAGRVWDPAKNMRALTAVAGSLPRPVLIAGELGSSPAPGLAGELGSSPAPGLGGEPIVANARLLGRLTSGELTRLRRRAAVFAAPAHYEPFGLAILEAAGARCALVLGDIPSLRELWEGCAEFVEPDDHEALLAKLSTLLLQPERAERIGARARLRAERLSPAPMAAAYAGLYREVIGEMAVCA